MTTKANIIIIEDEKNICSFIEHILEPQGYRVITANTGREGLQYITSEHPDVILLDLGLPDMDGLKLIEQVRSWSITPIIVISARTLEKSKIAALDLGADDYLTKPFGTGELLALIHPTRLDARLTNRWAIPPVLIISPIRIKNGTAIRE